MDETKAICILLKSSISFNELIELINNIKNLCSKIAKEKDEIKCAQYKEAIMFICFIILKNTLTKNILKKNASKKQIKEYEENIKYVKDITHMYFKEAETKYN